MDDEQRAPAMSVTRFFGTSGVDMLVPPSSRDPLDDALSQLVALKAEVLLLEWALVDAEEDNARLSDENDQLSRLLAACSHVDFVDFDKG